MFRGLPRVYWILWTGELINRLGSFVLPLLALYLTTGRGLSVESVGFVVALWGAGSLAAGPVGAGWPTASAAGARPSSRRSPAPQRWCIWRSRARPATSPPE